MRFREGREEFLFVSTVDFLLFITAFRLDVQRNSNALPGLWSIPAKRVINFTSPSPLPQSYAHTISLPYYLTRNRRCNIEKRAIRRGTHRRWLMSHIDQILHARSLVGFFFTNEEGNDRGTDEGIIGENLQMYARMSSVIELSLAPFLSVWINDNFCMFARNERVAASLQLFASSAGAIFLSKRIQQ